MSKVFLTGATGNTGKQLLTYLIDINLLFTAGSRTKKKKEYPTCQLKDPTLYDITTILVIKPKELSYHRAYNFFNFLINVKSKTVNYLDICILIKSRTHEISSNNYLNHRI